MVKTPRYEEAVLKVLGHGARFLSCREIHREMERALPSAPGSPSLSTIYRTVHRMAQEELLDTVHSPDGERLYRRCRTPARHHHLFCRLCGRVEEIVHLAELAEVAERVRGTSGFGELDYSFELTGVCPRCR
ncbi:transcriptional repressor [Nocardiopsis terrae]|uniref:Fur family ferric uptake transcriptional regulator n=1 Tax=Nocardiopsis terrae TaxID=372655 RepID=A0ABR9HHZ4_9ACTN|nr:transcriptional repressor [Nocardiopsis terrae]MBE1458623.1 Fur family ferric uptake transcriptional regulator [Nocardiopsis terrae]GHC79419.1 transcriptional repressor [Nocardiopsis terrae]